MLYHLDALNGASRRASVKFKFLSRAFAIDRCPREYAWEIAVLFATPGLLPRHIAGFMRWHGTFVSNVIEPILAAFEGDLSVIAAGLANAASITELDAHDMLMALIAAKRVGADLPHWCLLWIRHNPMTSVELARYLCVSKATVDRWIGGNPPFDPLSGARVTPV